MTSGSSNEAPAALRRGAAAAACCAALCACAQVATPPSLQCGAGSVTITPAQMEHLTAGVRAFVASTEGVERKFVGEDAFARRLGISLVFAQPVSLTLQQPWMRSPMQRDVAALKVDVGRRPVATYLRAADGSVIVLSGGDTSLLREALAPHGCRVP